MVCIFAPSRFFCVCFFFRAKADASAAKQKQDAGKKRQRVDTVDPLDPTGMHHDWVTSMVARL